MLVYIQTRSKKSLGSYTVTNDTLVEQLKQQIYQQNKKFYPERIYLTIGEDDKKTVLKNGTKISDYGITEGATITFKDLGPQISWRTVFMVEYFGPILMHCLVYFFPQFFYSDPIKPYTFTQTAAFWMVVLHFIKREYETIFIHRFSNDTMPAFNIIKNSAHYWILSGISIAYFVYHPKYTSVHNEFIVQICIVLFTLFELGNFYCHVILRNLRPEGTRQRGIPRGFLFEYVTCANYTLEIYAWIVFSYMTSAVTSWIFTIVAIGQIAIWSKQKHVRLYKEFGSAVPKRWILFPLIW